ncbi:hypothetical protein DVH24_019978 [Malus domestica]|uniref:Peptidase M28 domain-containing protein n=1 Tax=Malus domestica TaxID=3750 RepID=A0A498I1S6_MALDO|nr:hypothetical protein DVH24_019978 [Malus domestica]
MKWHEKELMSNLTVALFVIIFLLFKIRICFAESQESGQFHPVAHSLSLDLTSLHRSPCSLIQSSLLNIDAHLDRFSEAKVVEDVRVLAHRIDGRQEGCPGLTEAARNHTNIVMSPLASPGAADCGSCVASMLEIARLMVDSGWVLPRPVIFLFNGAEELFLLDSRNLGFPKIWFGIGLEIEIPEIFDLGIRTWFLVRYPIPNQP